MYTKVVVLMCAAGIASAGNLLHAAPVTYAAGPILTKTISPALSYQTISTHSAPTIAAYSSPYLTKTIAAPSVYSASPLSYSSVSAPLTYSSPLLTKTISAPVTTYAAGPAISTYASAPLVKSAIAYSPAPAVSHVTYTGLGVNYGW